MLDKLTEEKLKRLEEIDNHRGAKKERTRMQDEFITANTLNARIAEKLGLLIRVEGTKDEFTFNVDEIMEVVGTLFDESGTSGTNVVSGIIERRNLNNK